MKKNYYIDLKEIPLPEYQKELEQAELLPSRKMLKENIKNRFSILKKAGIRNLEDLVTATKTQEKLTRLCETTGLSGEYLTILKREVTSMQPKPVNLADFPSVSAKAISALEKEGIRNTKQLFDFITTEKERKELCTKTGIPYDELLELTMLTDLVRIRWVGANFARLLVDSGFNTVKKVAATDYRSLYPALMKINEDKKYFRGKFGQNDMKLCVLAAAAVPDAIEY